jgi:hypothetical protein
MRGLFTARSDFKVRINQSFRVAMPAKAVFRVR